MTCSAYVTAIEADGAGDAVVTLVQTTNVGRVVVDKNPHKPSATIGSGDTATDADNYAVGGTDGTAQTGLGSVSLEADENTITVTTTYDTGKELKDTVTLE